MSDTISIETLGVQAKAAESILAHLSTDQKNEALQKIADQLWQERAEILRANEADQFTAKANNIGEALLDRLMLNEKRLESIIADLRQVTELADPVNELLEEKTLSNGLHLSKRRVPLGVLAVIYEARPNVTVDVAGLALKSGNCVILRGGSETIYSNRALTAAIQRGLEGTAVPANAVQLISEPDRELVLELLQMDRYVDLVIPRGGAQLHEFCRRNSRIPVITGGMGICHLFVDESADLERSIEVIRNAKIQRPSVCNALDTCLVHRAVADEFLPRLVKTLAADGVTFRADPRAYAIGSAVEPEAVKEAGPFDFDTEWMALILGLKVVSGVEEAIEHIEKHSTHHSDGILTEDPDHAALFMERVDSAAVYVNASTRFTDGAQMGLGAEIAVSTQRLHARGPMGLNELTTYKWIIQGDYNVRA
jgi:glutamate-5-semialdehyde dehydrogenase